MGTFWDSNRTPEHSGVVKMCRFNLLRHLKMKVNYFDASKDKILYEYINFLIHKPLISVFS